MAMQFRDFDQFRNEFLRERAGPLTSPAEEIADEIYHREFTDEFESMWDSVDGEDE